MFSNYTDINLDIIRFLVVIKYNKTQFELQNDKKIILQNIITLKNSDELIKNDVQRYRNRKKITKTLETLIIHRKTN